MVVRWAAPRARRYAVTSYTMRPARQLGVRRCHRRAGATSATLTGLTNGMRTPSPSARRTRPARVRARPSGVTPAAAPGPARRSSVGNGGDASVVVRWTPPAGDGGSPVTGYTVRVFQQGAAVRWVDRRRAPTSTT